MTQMLFYAGLALVGAGLFIVVYTLAQQPPVERPVYGMRGLKRQVAMQESALFRVSEPVIRLVAAWMSGIALGPIRERVAALVEHSGDWLGLNANEVLGMSVYCGVLGAFAGIGVVNYLDWPTIVVVFIAGFGVMIPYLNMMGAMGERFKNINRALPAAIDLAALCMGAGLDFPGALRQISEKSSESSKDLVEEVNRILQELDLGHTRAQALTAFAVRCPTEAIQDFTGTVVQAEAKGTPLAEVLSIQARMLRMRRSVAAEEAAARAGLLLMMPLMLIFVVVIVLLMGPFIIRLSGSGV